MLKFNFKVKGMMIVKTFLISMMIFVSQIAFAQNSTVIDKNTSSDNSIVINGKRYVSQNEDISHTNISSQIRNETEQWGALSLAMASAVVTAAKEIGIAANDFSQTYLGKIIVFLVVWNYFGENIIHNIFGGIIIFTFIPIGLLMIYKSAISGTRISSKTETTVPILWNTWNRKVTLYTYEYNYKNEFTDKTGTICFIGIMLIIVGFIAGCAIIL